MEIVDYPRGSKAYVSKGEFQDVVRMLIKDFHDNRIFTRPDGECYRIKHYEAVVDSLGRRRLRFTTTDRFGDAYGEIVEQ